MKILSVKPQGNTTCFEVELDQKVWKTEFEKTKKNIIKNVQIPGFRKGHVPANMIAERYPDAAIAEETLRRSQIIGKTADEIIASPEFEKEDCIDGTSKMPEVVKFDTKSAPVIKFYFDNVPEVSGFDVKDVAKIEVPPFLAPEIPEAQIKNEIKALLKKDAMVSAKKDETVAKGNIAVINFKGFVDGKAFAGGEGKKYELEIGSKTFIDTFEDQLIGCKKGDKKDVNVKFPKDYGTKTLAGKDAKFEVEVLDVKEIEYPEINKEYLAKFKIEASNEKELGAYIRKMYADQAQLQWQDMAMRIINEAIGKKAKLNYYPDSLMNMHKNSILQQYTQEAQRSGFKTLEEYKKAIRVDEAKFDDILNESAKLTLVIAMVYQKLIDDYGIEVTEADQNDYLEKLIRYVGNKEQAKKFYDAQKDQADSFILRDKLCKKLVAEAKKMEPKAELKEDKKAK